MIPIVYEKDIAERNKTLCAFLPECLSCIVTEERNGTFELVLTYPAKGAGFKEILIGRIIEAKANQSMDSQYFRIYRITKPMNGVVTVYAQHISYDLAEIVCPTMTKRDMTCPEVLGKFLDATPFSFSTTFSTSKKFRVAEPKSIRSILMGEEGSVLSKWKGEFRFDNFVVYYSKARGTDKRNVVIEYGKNLISLEDDEDSTEAHNCIVPFVKINDKYLFLEGRAITDVTEENQLGREKDLLLDLTDEFEGVTDVSLISQSELETKAAAHLSNLDLYAIPSITVDFEAYTGFGEIFDKVDLCDIVTVRYTEYGIDVKAKVTTTEYDSLLERYTKITLGQAKSYMTDTVAAKLEIINDKVEKIDYFQALMDEAIQKATDRITGVTGGYVLLNSDRTGQPYEICIMDKPSIAEALKIWRWNIEGLGYSSTGYRGQFFPAITADGAIVADRITTGTLDANLLRAGTIESFDKSSKWNLETGDLTLAGKISASEGGNIGGFMIKYDSNKHAYYMKYTGNPDKSALGNDYNFGILPLGSSSAPTINGNAVENAALVIGSGFCVDTSGNLYAKNANIKGKIEGTSGSFSGTITAAKGGNIGGFKIKYDDSKAEYYLQYGDTLGSENVVGILPAGSSSKLDIAGVKDRENIALAIGENFGVDTDGICYSGGMYATEAKVAKNLYVDDNLCLYIGKNTSQSSGYTDRPVCLQYFDSKVQFGIDSKDLMLHANSKIYSNADIYLQSHKIYLNVSNTAYSCFEYSSDYFRIGNANLDMLLRGKDLLVGSDGDSTVEVRGVTTFKKNIELGTNSLKVNNGTSDYEALVATSSYMRFGDESFKTYVRGTEVLLGTSASTIRSRGAVTLDKQLDLKDNVNLYCGSTAKQIITYQNSNVVIGNSTVPTVIEGGNTITLNQYVNIPYGKSLQMNTDDASYVVLQIQKSNNVFTTFLGNSNLKTNIQGSEIVSQKAITVSSDRAVKTDIEDFDDRREELFKKLKPKTYRYTYGQFGRKHSGFIAQDVKEAIEESGLSTQEVAAYVEYDEPDQDGVSCGLRYEEFVSLNTYMIQKLMARVDELENKVKELEDKLNGNG